MNMHMHRFESAFSGQAFVLKSVFLTISALACIVFSSSLLAAQPGKYHYQWGYQTHYFESLEEAIAHARTQSDRAAYLQITNVSTENDSKVWTLEIPATRDFIGQVPTSYKANVSGYGCDHFGPPCSSIDEAAGAYRRYLEFSRKDCIISGPYVSGTPVDLGWARYNSWGHSANAHKHFAGLQVAFEVAKKPFTGNECLPPELGTTTKTTDVLMKEGFLCPVGYSGRLSDEGGSYASSAWCEASLITKIYGPLPGCEITLGNPCEILSGRKIEREEDLRTETLEFIRTYHSFSTDNATDLGNWRHGYQRRLIVVAYSNGTRPLFYVDAAENYAKALGSALGPHTLSGVPGARLVWDPAEESWTLERGVEKDVFSKSGRLIRFIRHGGETTLQYSPETGLLASVTDHAGRQLHFEYTEGMLGALVRPDGERIFYEYEEIEPPINSDQPRRRLSTVRYPDGTSRQYHYENDDFPLHLTGVTAEDGERFSTFRYDNAGQVITSERAGGTQKVTIQRNPDGTTDVIDPQGQRSTYRYTALHGMRRFSSAEGGPCATCSNTDQARTYFSNGYVKSRTDFNGVVTEYTRDAFGRELSRTEAKGTPQQRIVQTQWHITLGLPTLITEPGRTTGYTYDMNGNRLTETVTDTATGAARTTTWTYNALGRVETVNGPRTDVNDVTTYSYDSAGNLATITNALGHITQYTAYDAHGNPLTIIDPNGITTELAYDLRQRLIRRTIAAGTASAATTLFDYDLVGQLVRTTLPDGSWIGYAYDAAHRLTAIEDSAGNRLAYTLDAMGNRAGETVSGPDGAVFRALTRTYNTLNQLVSDTTPMSNGTSYTYDADGQRLTVTDAESNTTTNHYDALDRLFETLDALNGVTAYTYDARDNLTQVVDPRGVTTHYTYNGFDELIETDSPDAGITTYNYDAAGNRITQTDARGVTAGFTYDALNRLIAIDYPGTEHDIVYTYDALPDAIGRLTAIEDDTGRTEYAYDTRGNLEAKASQVNGTWLPLSYGYDLADRLSRITYPDGSVVAYPRDTHGRLTGVDFTPPSGATTNLVSSIGYAPFGPVNAFTFGNGLAETRTYDAAGRLDILSSHVLSLDYAWDATDNITSITDMLDATRNQSFDYDALYRLTDASGVYGSFGWNYDAVGNREAQTFTPSSGTPETTTYTYAAASNRLDTITDASGIATYPYDANGNTLADGDHTFVYDDRNRLVAALDATDQQNVGSYQHNALGQRVVKTTATGTVLFAYDEGGHLLGEYDETGNPIRQYVWLGDRPVAMLVPDAGSSGGYAIYYIHSDHLNTPQAVTDENQNIVWKADYQPFGEAEPTVTTLDMPLRFPGQYSDNETNLHYNYFRTYAPGIGRYTESDPIGLLGGLNTYSYAGNNAVVLQDPYGLAYFAKRPLSGAPWFDGGSHNLGSVDDRMNTELSHEHIFFEDGKSPANIGFGPKGLFTETSPQAYRTTGSGYDDCIMRIAVERAPVGEYCLLGIGGTKNNCQDWAERVRRLYHRIKNDPDVKQQCGTCQ